MIKKILSIFLCASIYLFTSIPVNASYIVDEIRYRTGLLYLVENGIEQKFIDTMSVAEICEYADAVSTHSETNYCAYIIDNNTGNERTEYLSSEQYKQLKNENSARLYTENDTTTSWLKLTIRSTLIDNDEYQLNNVYIITCYFEWLDDPIMRLKDYIAITFGPQIVPQADSIHNNAALEYTDREGRKQSSSSVSDIQYTPTGVCVEIDLPAHGNTDMYGRLSVYGVVNEFTDSTIAFGNWGYYAHKINPITLGGSVNILDGINFEVTPKSAYNVVNVGLLSYHEP